MKSLFLGTRFVSSLTKGGRGKKAPYKTVHYRIPEPIKPTVEILAEQYRQLMLAELGTEAEKMLERVGDAITDAKLLINKPDSRFVEDDLKR